MCRKGSDYGGGDGFGDCSICDAGSGDNVVEGGAHLVHNCHRPSTGRLFACLTNTICVLD